MPMSIRFVKVAHFVPIFVLGIGLVAVASCGPPQAGSVKVPESARRSRLLGYGPAGSKGKSPGLGPGDLRPAPSPTRAGTKPRGGRPTGARPR
jgi:hypothetical protein